MANKSLKVGLDVNVEQAKKSLDAFKAKVLESDKVWASFAGNILANAASGAISKFTGALANGFSRAIEEAQNAENEISNLNIALAQAGLYSEESSKQWQEYADSIEAVSAVSGGEVLKQIETLATRTSLTKEQIKQSADAARDLAAAYGMDVNQATELLAKAANGSTTQLEKLGVSFVKTKDSAQNYANILESLEKFQGASEAKSKTFSGQMQMLKNANDKLFESFGNLIIQNPIIINGFSALVAGIIKAAGWVQTFADFVNRNAEWLEPLAFGLAVAGTAFVAVGAKALIASGAFSVVATSASLAWAAITGPVGMTVLALAAVGAAAYAIVKHFDSIKAAAYNALAATLEFSSKGANAIGASGTSEALMKQAQAYRDKAQEIKAAQEIERQESTKTTDTVVNNTNVRTQAEIDAEQRLADLRAKRQKEIDDYTAKLADAANDEKLIYEAKLENLRFQLESEALLESEYDEFKNLNRLDRESQYIQLRQEMLDNQLAQETARIESSTLAQAEQDNAKLALQRTYTQNSQKLSLELAQKQVQFKKAQLEEEKKLDEYKAQSTANLFGVMANIAREGGAKSFGAYKVLSSAEAFIAGQLAISKALASGPPPWNFIQAAAVGLQTGLTLTKINTASPPAFQNGGIVPGNSYSGDKVIARVNSGEMIWNETQQQNLMKIANGGGVSSKVEGLLVELIQAVKATASISIDGKAIIDVVRDGIDSGRAIA